MLARTGEELDRIAAITNVVINDIALRQERRAALISAAVNDNIGVRTAVELSAEAAE